MKVFFPSGFDFDNRLKNLGVDKLTTHNGEVDTSIQTCTVHQTTWNVIPENVVFYYLSWKTPHSLVYNSALTQD